jgi:hypothetical protein
VTDPELAGGLPMFEVGVVNVAQFGNDIVTLTGEAMPPGMVPLQSSVYEYAVSGPMGNVNGVSLELVVYTSGFAGSANPTYTPHRNPVESVAAARGRARPDRSAPRTNAGGPISASARRATARVDRAAAGPADASTAAAVSTTPQRRSSTAPTFP